MYKMAIEVLKQNERTEYVAPLCHRLKNRTAKIFDKPFTNRFLPGLEGFEILVVLSCSTNSSNSSSSSSFGMFLNLFANFLVFYGF